MILSYVLGSRNPLKEFLILQEIETLEQLVYFKKDGTFQPKLKKLKSPLLENFLYANITKLLLFTQKKLHFYFREGKAPKKIWYCLKRKHFFYFGKRKPQNFLLLFRKGNFLIFQEKELFELKKWKIPKFRDGCWFNRKIKSPSYYIMAAD